MANIKQVSTTLLVAFAIISFWRGVWELMDIYLLPSNPTTSSIISVVLGIGIVYSVKHKLKPLLL